MIDNPNTQRNLSCRTVVFNSVLPRRKLIIIIIQQDTTYLYIVHVCTFPRTYIKYKYLHILVFTSTTILLKKINFLTTHVLQLLVNFLFI